MALDESALPELLDALRAGDGVNLIRDAVRLVMPDSRRVHAVRILQVERRLAVCGCFTSRMNSRGNTTRAPHVQRERHRGERAGWLRAAVLGADDGIVSVASLAIGVVAAGASRTAVVAASVAALVAGAMSMAAGEYVSVSSQRDTELADLERERVELADDPAGETRELAAIYRQRGLPAELATQVAVALMAHDPVEAHARDELGLHDKTRARPVQAAFSSASSFVLGALVPLLALIIATGRYRVPALVAGSMIALVVLGVAGAKAGGASLWRAAVRVGMWGGAAIAVTALVGHLFHTTAG